MPLLYHLTETFLVCVEMHKTPLFYVLEWLSLHSYSPKPREHEGTGIFDPLQNIPGGYFTAVLDPQALEEQT